MEWTNKLTGATDLVFGLQRISRQPPQLGLEVRRQEARVNPVSALSESRGVRRPDVGYPHVVVFVPG
jgi:hypothetical protein